MVMSLRVTYPSSTEKKIAKKKNPFLKDNLRINKEKRIRKKTKVTHTPVMRTTKRCLTKIMKIEIPELKRNQPNLKSLMELKAKTQKPRLAVSEHSVLSKLLRNAS